MHESREQNAALLALARKLRDVAIAAGRPDVVAKAEEAMALVDRGDGFAGGDGGQRDRDASVNTFTRILDGLGF